MSKDELRTIDVDDAIHARVVEEAKKQAFHEGAAEVAYGYIPSPIGSLLTAVTGRGLVAIAFEDERQDAMLDRLARQISPSVIDLPSAIGGVRDQLDAYFQGRLRLFDLPVDRQLFTPFQDKVLRATSAIPPGEVKTYGQVAAEAGRPKGAQATGQALGANPIPVIVPCHRVVAADGSLRGYAGGLDRKKFLLDLERGEQSLF